MTTCTSPASTISETPPLIDTIDISQQLTNRLFNIFTEHLHNGDSTLLSPKKLCQSVQQLKPEYSFAELYGEAYQIAQKIVNLSSQGNLPTSTTLRLSKTRDTDITCDTDTLKLLLPCI